MRGLARLVFLLVFLSFSASAYSTYIEHPWEYDYWKSANPGIERISGQWVWQPYGIDNTLILLRLGDINATMGLQESALVNAARDARLNAAEMKERCVGEIEYAEKTAFEKGIGWGIAAGTGPIGLLVMVILDGQHKQDYVEYCSSYGDAWEETMSKSMDSLAMSMDKADAGYSSLRAEFNSLNRTGLCDQDYSGAGHEECLEVQTAIDCMGSGSIEGSYGSYNIAKNNLDSIRNELNKESPDTALFSGTLNIIWEKNGVLEMLGSLRMKVNSSRASAEAAYDKVLYRAIAKKARVNDAIELLEKQDLELIKSAPIIQGTIGASETGTIAERNAKALQRASAANNLFSFASGIRSERTRAGYLKESVSNMAAADNEFGSLELMLGTLESDAEKVASEQEQTAGQEIAKAKTLISSGPASPYVMEKVRDAEKHLYDGQAAVSLGHQYEHYYLAAACAREAIAKNSVQPYIESKELGELKAELGAMILNAKKDGIGAFSQQQALDDLKGEDFAWVREQLIGAENEIVESAAIKYGPLEEKRSELIEKIKLVGGDADDQLTTMANIEQGIVDPAGKIDYKKGLGKLKALGDAYASVEETLDEYIKEIVAHSTMVDPELFMDEVALDELTKISIDLLVINTNAYGTENVALDAELPIPVDLLFTDITSGSELVGSVAMAGTDRVKIYMKRIEPFARHRITFETEKVIAHTAKASQKAIGLGSGSASIEEQIDFVLDGDVNSLAIPADMENAQIDGLAPGRQLKKGVHRLSSTYVMEDAYNESIVNLKATPLGLNSQIDYDITIDPAIGLDRATIFIDPNAKISNLNVVAMTGCSLGSQKKIAEGRYAYEVLGLSAGRQALIKASYILENASGYVASEISALEHGNCSGTLKALVAEARLAFDSGDANSALAKVQQAKALMKTEAAENEKTQRKIDELRSDIKAEADEIENVLASANGMNSSFVTRLGARLADLRERIRESSVMEPKDALRELEEVDMKWKNGEIKSFRKEVFDQYNQLKMRYAEAGNTSMPLQFLDLEEALNQLDATGRLEDALSLLAAQENAEEAAVMQEKGSAAVRETMSSYFESLADTVRSNLKKYSAESSYAKGTEFSPLFTYTEKEVEAKIAEIEKLIKSGDPKFLQSRLSALNGTNKNLEDTLNLLRNQALSKLELVEKLYNESAPGMSQSEQNAIEQKIANLKGLVSSGQYVNSLRAAIKVVDDISAAKGGGTNSLLLLGITALAILAVVAVYVFKQNEGRKKDGKILKKLERTEDKPASEHKVAAEEEV